MAYRSKLYRELVTPLDEIEIAHQFGTWAEILISSPEINHFHVQIKCIETTYFVGYNLKSDDLSKEINNCVRICRDRIIAMVLEDIVDNCVTFH